MKTAVFSGFFFLFPKRLKRCEASDRFLGCGPSSFLQSALSAARGGWAARIRPSSRLQELPLPLSMCSVPAQDRRDASHQHTCLRAWIPERAFHTPEVRLQVSVLWHLSPLRSNAKFRNTKLAFSLKIHLYGFQKEPPGACLTFGNSNACPTKCMRINNWVIYSRDRLLPCSITSGKYRFNSGFWILPAKKLLDVGVGAWHSCGLRGCVFLPRSSETPRCKHLAVHPAHQRRACCSGSCVT